MGSVQNAYAQSALPIQAGSAVDVPNLSSGELESFFEAMESGNYETMRNLLPRLLAGIKHNLSGLKAQVPELYEFLGDKKVDLLFQQAEKNLDILESRESAGRGGLASKIFGGLALVASVVTFLAFPSPLTATFLVMSVGLFIDSTVADLTDTSSVFEKLSGKLAELLDTIDFLEGLSPQLKQIISSVVVVVAITAAVFIAAKGGAAALSNLGFNGAAATGAQTAGMVSRETLAKIANVSNAVSETGKIGSSVFVAHCELLVQKSSGEIMRLMGDFQKTEFDSNQLIDDLSEWLRKSEYFDSQFS